MKKTHTKLIVFFSLLALLAPTFATTVISEDDPDITESHGISVGGNRCAISITSSETDETPDGEGGLKGCILIKRGMYWWSYLPLKKHGYGVAATNWIVPLTYGSYHMEGTVEFKFLDGHMDYGTFWHDSSWSSPKRIFNGWITRAYVYEEYRTEVDYIRMDFTRQGAGFPIEEHSIYVDGNNGGGGGGGNFIDIGSVEIQGQSQQGQTEGDGLQLPGEQGQSG